MGEDDQFYIPYDPDMFTSILKAFEGLYCRIQMPTKPASANQLALSEDVNTNRGVCNKFGNTDFKKIELKN